MEIKTSDTHPIRVDWLPLELPGKVGLTFAPGKHQPAAYTNGIWERDLGKDLDRLVGEYGMQLQVCLLEDHELPRLGIPHLVEEAEWRGVEVHRFPIPDFHVPSSVETAFSTVQVILSAAREGRNVVIHCAGGIGRTGVLAGCVLVELGHDPEKALEILCRVRGANVPESEEQKRFITRYAQERLPD